MDFALLDGYVDLDEAARRMGMSRGRVIELVRIRALRAVSVLDEIWVEPAITNVA